MKAQLVERLKTPVDSPSWGPDWVKHGRARRARPAAQARRARSPSPSCSAFSANPEDAPQGRQALDVEAQVDRPRESAARLDSPRAAVARLDSPRESAARLDSPRESAARPDALDDDERDDASIIARNMEKSRQVAHYRPLYGAAVMLAIAVALLAMFVDYQIIRGDVGTRALSNEFMVVPASLKASVILKSCRCSCGPHRALHAEDHRRLRPQCADHDGVRLRTVMIGCLGYLVAYNNMAGGTSTTLEQHDNAAAAPAATRSTGSSPRSTRR